MTRSESQAQTRQRLLQAASDLFRRDGYAITSVDRIAEAAGYTKGALYSNFGGKEAIFLESLDADARGNLAALLRSLERAGERETVIALIADWADERSRYGGWSLSVLEYVRITPAGSSSSQELEQIVRNGWRELGSYLRRRFPVGPSEPEVLGALLFEIAYAPGLTFLSTPTAGDLVRLVLPVQLGEPVTA